MADVNKDGEVTVEEQFVGRLEGFQFRQDASASPDEAKTLRSASLQALAPEFHLRADRMYNAPDTEIDFTEQGGLMWGSSAVGKLIPGSNALKPHVQAFVDVEAGPEVAEKVTRRLQHFIDRKIATLFEPLINMQRDESLTGMARGFAFQMIEGLGVLDRADVGEDVKSLDQEARSALAQAWHPIWSVYHLHAVVAQTRANALAVIALVFGLWPARISRGAAAGSGDCADR